jgi:release factor glutamine methyltransferase
MVLSADALALAGLQIYGSRREQVGGVGSQEPGVRIQTSGFRKFAVMTLQEAQQQLTVHLYQVYDNREAANIADWVMEHITGWKKMDRIVNKTLPLPPDQQQQLVQFTSELLTHKPIQYVLHEAWFAGMKLYVDEQVLIPRPETEELVEDVGSLMSEVRGRMPEAVPSDVRLQTSALRLLDIGTGSGCIPIALKKKLPGAEIYACDVSEGALAVAKKNAATHGTAITFFQLDFLDDTQWDRLPQVDLIISNPPYIPLHDQANMQRNVLDYEPHLALFVSNNDPLLFYKAIAAFALNKLSPGGTIYAEIHEDLGMATRELFIAKGFADVQVKKDMQGKDRVVKAKK